MDLPNKLPPSPFAAQKPPPKSLVLEGFDGKLAIVARKAGMLYARIYLGGNTYKFVSLDTRSWNEAPELARKAFYKIEAKLEVGAAVKRLVFKDVWADFIKQLGNEVTLKHRTQSTYDAAVYSGGYLVEFLGKLTIEQIDPHKVAEFVLWRRNKASEAGRTISAKTLNTHIVHLKQCLTWAAQAKRATVTDLTFKRVKQDDARRPAFSIEDYRKLYKFLRAWAPARRETDTKAYNRQMLRHIVLIGANTGMRPGELLHLRWKDVSAFKDQDGRENYRFTVTHGKTVKFTGARDVIGRVAVKGFLDRWKELSKFTKPDDYIFHGEDGGVLEGADISFRRMLLAANMRVDENSTPHTMYSLRHTYATFYLKYRKNPDVFLLAMNMGTSVDQIRRHYGQIKVMDKATHLGG
ncbi:MAG: site-specific integrase [Ignavibacteria bacterium]|nr:site-specific integrase [Ignavibacteria bacterium]